MSTEIKKEIAHVLFIDIVGYSKLIRPSMWVCQQFRRLL